MEKKTVFVTGAGTGFGHDLVFRLSERGHKVIAGVQITPQITQLRSKAKAKGLEITVEKIDILDKADIEYAWETFDIDVLFNNAGIGESGPLTEMPMPVFKSQFDTNLFAPLELSQGFAKKMASERKGKIIFVSSIAGFMTGKYSGAYCASKHALEAVAEAMRLELRDFGVQVATINPGPYQTGFNDRLMETYKKWLDPDRSLYAPEDIRFHFEQYDPTEMVEMMVKVIEEDNPKFRNLLPQKFINIVKDFQSRAWSLRSMDKA